MEQAGWGGGGEVLESRHVSAGSGSSTQVNQSIAMKGCEMIIHDWIFGIVDGTPDRKAKLAFRTEAKLNLANQVIVVAPPGGSSPKDLLAVSS